MKVRLISFLFIFFSLGLVFAQNGKKIKVPVTSQNLTPQVCKVAIFGKELELKTRDDFVTAIEDFRVKYYDKLMVAVYNPDIAMVKVNHGIYKIGVPEEVYWVDGEKDAYYMSLNVQLIDVVDGISVRSGWAPNTKYISELDKLKKAYLAIYPNDELKILGNFKSINKKTNIMLFCDLYDGDNLVETKHEAILGQYLGQSFGHRVFYFYPIKGDGDYSIKFRFADLKVDPNVIGKEESIQNIEDSYDAETLTLQEFYDQTYGDCLELVEFDEGVYTLAYPDFIKYEWKNHFSRFLGVEANLNKYFNKYPGYGKKGMEKGDFHPWMYKQKGENKSFQDVLKMKNHSSKFYFGHDGKTYRLADYGWIYIPEPSKLNADVYDVKQITARIGR